MTKANTRRRPRQVKKVRMLLALSWSNERIAHALRISKPTLRKRFGDLIADKRGGAADTLEARFYELLWQQVEAGNASAMKLWMQLQQLLTLNIRVKPFLSLLRHSSSVGIAWAVCGRHYEGMDYGQVQGPGCSQRCCIGRCRHGKSCRHSTSGPEGRGAGPGAGR